MDTMDWQQGREAGVLAAVATGDLEALRKYSILPGGYGSDVVRRRVWCVAASIADSRAHLLHAEERTVEPKLESHPDEGQVLLDTKRSFVYYPKGEAPTCRLISVSRRQAADARRPPAVDSHRTTSSSLAQLLSGGFYMAS